MTAPLSPKHFLNHISFTEKDKKLLKQEFYPLATNEQIELFLSICEKKQLDPFTRQIYMKLNFDSRTNRNKMSIVTTIDGLRLTAERSGKYAGQVGPFWCDKEGKWADVWLDSTKHPVASKVGVLRHDFKESMFGIANFESYVQTDKNGSPTMIWKKMGPLMVAKCAEALALRKAFPEEMSGLYTDDELGEEPEGEKKETKTPKADAWDTILAAGEKNGWDEKQLDQYIHDLFYKKSFAELDREQQIQLYKAVSAYGPTHL